MTIAPAESLVALPINDIELAACMGRVTRALRAIVLLVIVWLAQAAAVSAEGVADCKSEAFRAALKLEPNFGFDCEEISRITPPVDGGRWTIRALRNASTEEGYVKVYAEAYMSAAEAAFIAWEPYVTGLGLKYGNVSIMFTDPEGSEIDFLSHVAGEGFVMGAAHADGFSFPQDCIVSVNMEIMAKAEIVDMTANIAHELFHCVQFWSLPPAAVSPGEGAQAWWQEGTANFFTALAVPGAVRTAVGAETFLATIHEKPLTQQGYNSTIFFAFLNQQGMPMLDAFFKGLATVPGETAQMHATEEALGEKTLQEFAEAVMDGTIALPSGFAFPAFENPEPFIFAQDGQFEAGKIPFTIDARQISFIGGSYAVAQIVYQARQAEGGAWGSMPNLVEPATCKEPVEFLVTRLVGTSIGQTMGSPFVATRYAECHICQTLPEQDQCLIGTWKLRDQSMLSYLMQATADSKNVLFNEVKGTVTLKVEPAGKAVWTSTNLKVHAGIIPDDFPVAVTVDVETNGTLEGRWSTSGSDMHFCAERTSGTHKSTVKVIGGAEDVVTTGAPLADSYLTYECHKDRLTLIYNGPGEVPSPAPSFTMDRIQ
ncbi:MAG TPA: hypothetical protein PKA03_13090 [Tabrizicola sp.]|nr:hypothetical protein [Tabrizicola sp.]